MGVEKFARADMIFDVVYTTIIIVSKKGSTCLKKTHTHTHTHILYRCPRRNGPNFGRVFLMLNYTDITQNTYIQS